MKQILPTRSIALYAACGSLLTTALVSAPAHAAKAAKRAHRAAASTKAKATTVTPLPAAAPTARGATVPVAAPALPAASGMNATVIYSGEPLSSGGQIRVASWGGGQVSDHQGDAFTTAGHTIQVDTGGLYQGGQIVFNSPVSLGDLKSDKTRFLQIIFSASPSRRYPQTAPRPAVAPGMSPYGMPPGYGGPRGGYGGLPPGYGGPPTGFGGPPSGYGQPSEMPFHGGDYHDALPAGAVQIAQVMPPPWARGGQRGGPPAGYGGPPPGYGGPPSGYRGPNGPGMGAPAPADETAALPSVPIRNLHVVMEFSNGARAEMLRPITVSLGEDINWLRAGIPLASIPVSNTAGANAQLSRLYISSDTPAALSIGEIRLINDTTPITADAGRPQTIPLGTPVTLVGSGEGGASTLKYEWNFDSPGNFAPEAEGVKATYLFPNEGDHVVTLRVSDVDGLKSPATSTVTIHVVNQGQTAPGMGVPPGMGMPPGYGGPPPGYGGPPNPYASRGGDRGEH